MLYSGEMFITKREYRKAWGDAHTKDFPIPLNIDIELASVCNLTCPFCFISDDKFAEMISQPSMDGKSRRRLMPKQMAFNLIDEAVRIGVPALKFNWRGESTMHPDYAEIMWYARASTRINPWTYLNEPAFHEILVNTNANCKDEAIAGLMQATKVMVSLDSCRPETYAIMRRGGKLERAIQVVLDLISKGHENIWVRRVMSKDNEHEDFYTDCRAIFGDKVKISEHHCFDRNANSSHEVGCDHDELPRKFCGYPAQRIVVSSSGLCYPCCIDLHETMPVGDINKQTLLKIWNGEPMRKLRTELRHNKITSKACQGCVSWMAYDAPQRESVQDIEI
jgi:radical SAM protein with 4Fe4S-binding SPASM domain